MKPKLLIVEDDKLLCNFLVELFADYEVLTAVDGIYGLRFARIQRPDIIIIDLGLPRMGGAQFMQKLEEDPALKEIPVVLISGTFEQEYRGEKIPEYHASAVFTKPFHQDLFAEKVRELLAASRSQ